MAGIAAIAMAFPAVLILFNQPRSASTTPESEIDVLDQVKSVREALHDLGAVTREVGVSCLDDIRRLIAVAPEKVVFNLVEELTPPEFAADAHRIIVEGNKACTGCSCECLRVCNDKYDTKRRLTAAGVPVPSGVLVPRDSKVALADAVNFAGPYMVKACGLHASEGIDAGISVVADGDMTALARAVTRLHEEYRQDAVVEQFVGDMDITVPIVRLRREPDKPGSADDLHVLRPYVLEYHYPEGHPPVLDYDAKWCQQSAMYARYTVEWPLIEPPVLLHRLVHCAIAAFRATLCSCYSRIDFRVSSRTGQIWCLEVNPNPDICTDCWGFSTSLVVDQIPFRVFVREMIQNALDVFHETRGHSGEAGTVPVLVPVRREDFRDEIKPPGVQKILQVQCTDPYYSSVVRTVDDAAAARRAASADHVASPTFLRHSAVVSAGLPVGPRATQGDEEDETLRRKLHSPVAVAVLDSEAMGAAVAAVLNKASVRASGGVMPPEV